MNPKTKVYLNNKQIYPRDKQGRFSSFKTMIAVGTRKLFRATVGTLAGLAVIYVACLAWSYYTPNIVLAEKIVTVESTKKESLSDYPMLAKICHAENTSDKQFKANGDVVRGLVDKSDIGLCQINERYNNDLARRLGYDIYSEEGNIKMAIYLFKTRGAQPWEASKGGVNGWGNKI